MKCWIFILGLVWMWVACSPTERQASTVSEVQATDSIIYASGFHVTRFADYTRVEVRDPWDSTRLLQRYLLVDRNQPIPSGLPKGTVVKIPVDRGLYLRPCGHAGSTAGIGSDHRGL